jgi:hypothetical protein
VANLDHELRRALESGDFESALPLIREYGGFAVRGMKDAKASDEQAEIFQTSTAYLYDRLHLARVMRAQLASRIALFSRIGLYQEEASKMSNTWQLEA